MHHPPTLPCPCVGAGTRPCATRFGARPYSLGLHSRRGLRSRPGVPGDLLVGVPDVPSDGHKCPLRAWNCRAPATLAAHRSSRDRRTGPTASPSAAGSIPSVASRYCCAGISFSHPTPARRSRLRGPRPVRPTRPAERAARHRPSRGLEASHGPGRWLLERPQQRRELSHFVGAVAVALVVCRHRFSSSSYDLTRPGTVSQVLHVSAGQTGWDDSTAPDRPWVVALDRCDR